MTARKVGINNENCRALLELQIAALSVLTNLFKPYKNKPTWLILGQKITITLISSLKFSLFFFKDITNLPNLLGEYKRKTKENLIH